MTITLMEFCILYVNFLVYKDFIMTIQGTVRSFYI